MISQRRLDDITTAVISQQEHICDRYEVAELVLEAQHRRRMQQLLEQMAAPPPRTATQRLRDVFLITTCIIVSVWFLFFA